MQTWSVELGIPRFSTSGDVICIMNVFEGAHRLHWEHQSVKDLVWSLQYQFASREMRGEDAEGVQQRERGDPHPRHHYNGVTSHPSLTA